MLYVMEHEQREVWIEGQAAQAIAIVRAPKALDLNGELMSVKDAADMDKALGDPGNTHLCPLCNEYFGTEAFKAHAPDCIRALAPRWERQRDRDPAFKSGNSLKVFRSKLFRGGGV